MCYKEKCYTWRPPLEKGCLILAILTAIAHGVLLVASIIMGITFAGPARDPAPSSVSHILGNIALGMLDLAIVVAITIVGVFSLISLIFSMLLCNGIYNRRPNQVKAYFIYGIVITVLAAVFSIILVPDKPKDGILGLLGCVIYSLFLVLVYKTYTKLSAGAGVRDHIQLVEDAC